jgi:arylformamidase
VMRIYDVSLPLTKDLPVWPGDPAVVIRQTQSLDQGNQSDVSRLEFGAHARTHPDAPFHFIENGNTVDQIPLERLIGPSYVCYLPDVKEITAAELEKIHFPRDMKRLLLRTRNSELWAKGVTEFTAEYVALTPGAAQWIVDQGIELIGID